MDHLQAHISQLEARMSCFDPLGANLKALKGHLDALMGQLEAQIRPTGGSEGPT